MTKVKLIHGCYQVGCRLAFNIEGKVLEGVVRFASTLDSDIYASVEVNGSFYELMITNGDASVVGPLYQEAA